VLDLRLAQRLEQRADLRLRDVLERRRVVLLDQFAVSTISCPDGGTLEGGGTRQFKAAFAPTFVGSASGTSHVTAVGVASYDFRVQGDGANAIPTFGRTGIALPVLAHCSLGSCILRRW
jgi:hypothetical protein